MPRSTRKKIRDQIATAAAEMDIAIEHLEYALAFSQGRSQVMNETIPKLALMLQGCKQVLLQFRNEL